MIQKCRSGGIVPRSWYRSAGDATASCVGAWLVKRKIGRPREQIFQRIHTQGDFFLNLNMLCDLYVLYDVFDFSRIRPIAQDKGINIEYLALAIWDELRYLCIVYHISHEISSEKCDRKCSVTAVCLAVCFRACVCVRFYSWCKHNHLCPISSSIWRRGVSSGES